MGKMYHLIPFSLVTWIIYLIPDEQKEEITPVATLSITFRSDVNFNYSHFLDSYNIFGIRRLRAA